MRPIIQGTPKTEVYVNELGGICIKQENENFDEDQFVYFSIEETEKIIKEILETKEEALEIKKENEEIIRIKNGGNNDKE